nr:hypothetical protein [uncultured Treponema sp.]
MKNILRKILKTVAAVLSAAAAFFVFIFFSNRKKIRQKIDNAKIKAQKEKESVYEKIKGTDSSDLVDNAYNADELYSITNGIKQDAAETIQHKISEAGL